MDLWFFTPFTKQTTTRLFQKSRLSWKGFLLITQAQWD